MDDARAIPQEHRIARIRGFLSSPVWQEDIEPFLRSRSRSVLSTLRDRSKERKDATSDDELFGRLKEIEAFLFSFEKIIVGWDDEQRSIRERQAHESQWNGAAYQGRTLPRDPLGYERTQ